MDNLPDIPEKGRYRFQYRGTNCLNCDHPLDISDRYCPNCSQANSTKKLSLKDFLDEFFASLMSYDSKLLKTLGALLLRPGKITREYIAGKRVSYTNPFRFLLSLTILYFLMINFTGNFSKWDKYGAKEDSYFIESLNDFSFSFGTEEGTEINRGIDSIKQALDFEALKLKIKKQDSLILSDPSDYFKNMGTTSNENQFSQKQEFFTTLLRSDSIYDFKDAVDKYGVAESFGNKLAFNVAHGILKLRSRPGSFISRLISKLPFAVFFFLPVFALFIWLVYIRKKYSYTDHLIFSFHNTALLFILLIISYLIDGIFAVSSNWIFLAIFSLYLLQAMRKFYGQGIFKTCVKYLFLNFIFFILSVFAILILFTGNIFTN
ncbi:DUF3667 domain-containing protein [Pricia sp.]|uniref:DUF3667 domain-containing protein n=1 Tax=Pricia sp. TaxID=2268138 RepID=UPI0035946366